MEVSPTIPDVVDALSLTNTVFGVRLTAGFSFGFIGGSSSPRQTISTSTLSRDSLFPSKACQRFQCIEIIREQLRRNLISVGDDPSTSLSISIAVCSEKSRCCEISSSKEDLFIFLAEMQVAKFHTHPPLAHHTTRSLSGHDNVLPRASRDLIENNFFSHY